MTDQQDDPTMRSVPPPTEHEVEQRDAKGDPPLRVTGLAVELESNQRSMPVSFRCKDQVETSTFALTPPAAHQLAKELRKVVWDYLNGTAT
ncbi:MAG: hypothetical protein OXP28_00580 [Gammaproteobacteria bacterium]|nr:hypothetical protein [Gammaproteobacteria bacterium]